MTPSPPLIVYLCYGPGLENLREIRYGLETLLPEIGFARERVVIYTDRPERFADLDVQTIDARELLKQAFALGYRHRAKPIILADALRRFGRACAMLDSDGFIRPGFEAEIKAALAAGAAMNQFVRRDPFPELANFATTLPRFGAYRLDRETAVMWNSGLVALQAEHLPLVEDAIALIDALCATGSQRHDIEQFAVSEMLRLNGVEVALIDRTFEHYCPRWSKRYMRRRLRRRQGQRIPFSKTRVRLFKGYWNLRLAMRKARASWRGLKWRKT